MRTLFLIFASVVTVFISGCTGLPASIVPDRFEAERGPFYPRDMFPIPPNVESLIGPDDCQGATLAAVSASVPEYPMRAWEMGRQGWVVVRFHVYSDGSVHQVRVARSVPDGPFDRVSRRAVGEWRFLPLEGVDVLQNCVVMFEFRAGEVRIR